MPIVAKYICLELAHKFEAQLLNPTEVEELMRRNPGVRPTKVVCKACGSPNVKRIG